MCFQLSQTSDNSDDPSNVFSGPYWLHEDADLSMIPRTFAIMLPSLFFQSHFQSLLSQLPSPQRELASTPSPDRLLSFTSLYPNFLPLCPLANFCLSFKTQIQLSLPLGSLFQYSPKLLLPVICTFLCYITYHIYCTYLFT